VSVTERGPGGVTCIEVVELMTDYIEGALTPSERERFEVHLSLCPPCRDYLDQIRATIGAARITEDGVPPSVMDELLHAFRDFRRD